MSDIGMPSSINKSMFHQLMVIIIPGALVVIPFCMAIYMLPSDLGFRQLLITLEYEDFAIYSIVSFLILLSGMLLENIGSCIEDSILDKDNKVSTSAWRAYLFSDCGDDKINVIHKYIDQIAFRYKFELSLIPALIIFFLEWIWIGVSIEPDYFNDQYTAFITAFIIIIFFFTCRQAKVSCKYLNELRCAFMAYSMRSTKIQKSRCEECTKATYKRCKVCGQKKKRRLGK